MASPCEEDPRHSHPRPLLTRLHTYYGKTLHRPGLSSLAGKLSTPTPHGLSSFGVIKLTDAFTTHSMACKVVRGNPAKAASFQHPLPMAFHRPGLSSFEEAFNTHSLAMHHRPGLSSWRILSTHSRPAIVRGYRASGSVQHPLLAF